MSGTIKRLDLQFGSFACSVQGFDDPVQPVQQVLQALQNLLEETPELGDSGISFDAEAIERLVGEVARRADLAEEDVEIVPGLIIVHRSGGAAAGDAQTHGGAYDEGGNAWPRSFVDGAADTGDADTSGSEQADAEGPEESREPEAVEDAEPGYINIFTPGDHAGTHAGTHAGAESGSGLFTAGADGMPEPGEAETAPTDDPFAARLGRMTTAETDAAGAGPHAATEDGPGDDLGDDPIRDIFADPGESADGGVFADPMAAKTGAEPVDEDAAVNFFSAPDRTDESGDEIGDEPGASGPSDSGNMFASVEPEDAEEDQGEDPGEDTKESERVEVLFGRSDDQPEVEEADEGYTAAGLAVTAGAETVADFIVCAAAWMVLLQGQTTFTRHDVIDVFETIPGEHSKTLEARIKGFGKAVRNGQLIMIEDGVYGLSRIELERFQLLL